MHLIGWFIWIYFILFVFLLRAFSFSSYFRIKSVQWHNLSLMWHINGCALYGCFNGLIILGRIDHLVCRRKSSFEKFDWSHLQRHITQGHIGSWCSEMHQRNSIIWLFSSTIFNGKCLSSAEFPSRRKPSPSYSNNYKHFGLRTTPNIMLLIW